MIKLATRRPSCSKSNAVIAPYFFVCTVSAQLIVSVSSQFACTNRRDNLKNRQVARLDLATYRPIKRGTMLETKESRSLGAYEVSPGFVSLDIGSKRRSRWGKMLKSFSKEVIPSVVW